MTGRVVVRFPAPDNSTLAPGALDVNIGKTFDTGDGQLRRIVAVQYPDPTYALLTLAPVDDGGRT